MADSWGNMLALAYDADMRVASLADPAGNITKYTYDGNGNLATVSYPDGKSIQYLYENSTYTHLLTGLIDENGERYASWSYDSQGRAISNVQAGGVGNYTLDYTPRPAPAWWTLSRLLAATTTPPSTASSCPPAPASLAVPAAPRPAPRSAMTIRRTSLPAPTSTASKRLTSTT
ncbi:hypothetical protein JOS77_18680 [Chromobacterium haemolyticum]|nr:hypothetical protein JOS77_18680 [Chromobacterium haemolyticum]